MRDAGFRTFIEDQLAGLGALVIRPMFGGYGLYDGNTFFGIIHRGRLYFKTDDATRPAYEAEGMKPFRPSPRQTLWHYYEVPASVLEDAEEAVLWARRAVHPHPARRITPGRPLSPR
ncbi:MAG TPA: TfoX/Sxy family protein [bacterium]